jgi:hypothetical protein
MATRRDGVISRLRQRLPQRKHIATAIALCLVPVVAAVGWFGYHRYQGSGPVLQAEFWELRPGMTRLDVLFRKGRQGSPEDKNSWVYLDEWGGYAVSFKEGRVRSVIAWRPEDKGFRLPTLQGISGTSTLEDIEKKFGAPDAISVSEDQLRRSVSYLRYGLLFFVEKDRVYAAGMLDPKQGPVRFENEAVSR